jgi:hypothetical protein
VDKGEGENEGVGKGFDHRGWRRGMKWKGGREREREICNMYLGKRRAGVSTT